MSEAIENKACDVIGLARPAVLRPDIPKALILNPKVEQVDLSGEMPTVPVPWFIRLTGVRVLGAGAQTVCCLRVELVAYSESL